MFPPPRLRPLQQLRSFKGKLFTIPEVTCLFCNPVIFTLWIYIGTKLPFITKKKLENTKKLWRKKILLTFCLTLRFPGCRFAKKLARRDISILDPFYILSLNQFRKFMFWMCSCFRGDVHKKVVLLAERSSTARPPPPLSPLTGAFPKIYVFFGWNPNTDQFSLICFGEMLEDGCWPPPSLNGALR